MDFSSAIIKRMKEKKIRQNELAKLINYSPQHVNRLLKGIYRWNINTMNLVCNALDLTMEVKPKEESDGGLQNRRNNHPGTPADQDTGRDRTSIECSAES
jgi:transcriptional regulator with XRE-family HTH domain